MGVALLLVLLASGGALGGAQLAQAFSNAIADVAAPSVVEPNVETRPSLQSRSEAAGLSTSARVARQIANAATEVERGARSLRLGSLSSSAVEDLVRALPAHEAISLSFDIKRGKLSVLKLDDELRDAGLMLPTLSDQGARIAAQGMVGYRAPRFVGERLSDARRAERAQLADFNAAGVYRSLLRRAQQVGLAKTDAHDEAFYGTRRYLELAWHSELPEWHAVMPDILLPEAPRPRQVAAEVRDHPGAYSMIRQFWDKDIREGVQHVPERYQKFHRVRVRDGLLIDPWGRPITTLPEREHIFALTLDRQLLEGVSVRDNFHHSSLTSGRSGLAFGRLQIEQGLLKALNPTSGHFLPHADSLDLVTDTLQAKGADLSQTVVSRNYDP